MTGQLEEHVLHLCEPPVPPKKTGTTYTFSCSECGAEWLYREYIVGHQWFYVPFTKSLILDFLFGWAFGDYRLESIKAWEWRISRLPNRVLRRTVPSTEYES